jgi:hypothetical protein
MNVVLRHAFESLCLCSLTISSFTNLPSHLQHVNTVLSALRVHQLRLKRSKCSFAQPTIRYLGYVISADGVAMDQDKVAAITT